MKRVKFIILFTFIFATISTTCYSQVDTITVDLLQTEIAVNHNLFGTNIPSKSSGTFQDLTSSIFIDRMKGMGISLSRWPSGNNYNWRINASWRNGTDTTGISLDEIVQICNAIGCELQIKVSFGTMNSHDAADLVRYCEDSLHTKVTYWEIGNEIQQEHSFNHSWTALDARKYYFGGSEERRGTFKPSGYSQSPYAGFKGDLFPSDGSANQRWLIHFPDVEPESDSVFVGKYPTTLTPWERVNFDTVAIGNIGNYYEMDYDSSVLKFGDGIKGRIPPSGWGVLCEYTTINHDGYIAFVDSMKAVDPTIKTGSCFQPDTTWSTETLDSVFSRIDFIIAHQYSPERVDSENPYYKRMTYAPDMLSNLFGIRKWLDRWAGTYDIGIGLTEWNFIIAVPIHKKADASMASALFAAEKLGSLIQYSDSLRMQIANQFRAISKDSLNYNNLLRFGDYLQRPTAYVFKMFNNFFGNTLVKNTVACQRFQQGWRQYPYYPYLVAYSSKKDNQLFLLVVNKDSANAHQTLINFKNFNPDSFATAHILNGDSIYATNESNPETVTIKDSTISNVSDKFIFTFPAHSVTALEFNTSTTYIHQGQKFKPTFLLENAYRNPFNLVTIIKYEIPKFAFVTLKVYNTTGQLAATLVNEQKAAGKYSVTWDAENLSSGVYFYRIKAGNFSYVRKGMVLK